MAYPDFGPLRISPKFTTVDWKALDLATKDAWSRVAEIVRDRLDGRFLSFARLCLESPQSGFVVLAIDSLLLETIQQFRDGVVDGHGRSEEMVCKFLTGPRFQPNFDEAARKAFYRDIRCGLLHQAEAREMWLIRRDQETMLRHHPAGARYVIDVQRFHSALELSFTDYLDELRRPEADELRKKLSEKMTEICNVRNQRGVVFADEP